MFPAVAANTQPTGFKPMLIKAINTASELKGTTVPAIKAERNMPQ
jgi:hypothetical protein